MNSFHYFVVQTFEAIVSSRPGLQQHFLTEQLFRKVQRG